MNPQNFIPFADPISEDEVRLELTWDSRPTHPSRPGTASTLERFRVYHRLSLERYRMRTETGKTSIITSEADVGPRQSLGELTFPSLARH
jgi:hypothetical protein